MSKSLREKATAIATEMSKALGLPVSVSGDRLKDRVAIEIEHPNFATTRHTVSTAQVEQWSELDEITRVVAIRKACDKLKTSDQLIFENLETIKASLETLI